MLLNEAQGHLLPLPYVDTSVSRLNIVTHMPIARQRFNKHIPETYTLNKEGRPLLGNGRINTHS
jgi:hypothetical protein